MDNLTSYHEIPLAEAENIFKTANFSFPNVTGTLFNSSDAAKHVKGGFTPISVAFKVVYVVGILGNLGAIVTLRTGERRVRNRKHLLLLTALAGNDLIALVGMLCAMVVSEILPYVGQTQYYCAVRVVLRVFGIGSVCIAVTMALERYLALTRPFLYHKRVTYYVIRTTLLVSWFMSALLTCAPLLGVGAYWDEKGHCTRYKKATEGLDFGYAVVYVAFGSLLGVILVYCNLAVTCALSAISSPRTVRRVSRRSCPNSAAEQQTFTVSAATAEEFLFSVIMVIFSFLFILCWMPQMVISALYLALGEPAWGGLAVWSLLADLLMLLNYVLDPILYVLMGRTRLSAHGVWRVVAACCKHRHHKSSTGSTKTSACLQDTLLTSESYGAEMRPLRSRIVCPAQPPPPLLQLP